MNPHPSLFAKLANLKTDGARRRYLKQFYCTRAEQDKLISMTHKRKELTLFRFELN